MKITKIKNIIILELSFLIYSISSLLSKLATQSGNNIIICYGLSLFMLGIYAIIWQQVLNRMPLSTAFASKGSVIIWGMIWSVIIFSEKITFGMIIGSIIIIFGIIIMMTGDKDNG